MKEKELAVIDHVKTAYRKYTKVGCTGCHYCLPCPSGVNIPYCFECYNNLGLGSPMIAKMMYLMYVGGGIDGSGSKGLASQCSGCGRCVKACTQQIDIPVELRKAAKELESPGMKIRGLAFRPLPTSYMKYDRWRSRRRY